MGLKTLSNMAANKIDLFPVIRFPKQIIMAAHIPDQQAIKILMLIFMFQEFPNPAHGHPYYQAEN